MESGSPQKCEQYLEQLFGRWLYISLLLHDPEASFEADGVHLLLQQRHQIAECQQHAENEVAVVLVVNRNQQTYDPARLAARDAKNSYRGDGAKALSRILPSSTFRSQV